MTEKERKNEKKEKEEGYGFLTLRVKTEWIYIYLHASQHHQKREKKSLKILSYLPTLSSYLFFFSQSASIFFFNLLWDRIHACMHTLPC